MCYFRKLGTNRISDLFHWSTVLLGRGKRCDTHEGNVQLQQLVDSYRKQYSSGACDKTAIIRVIVRLIQEKGGRFLELSTSKSNQKTLCSWVEVPDEKAWSRVGRRYRK